MSNIVFWKGMKPFPALAQLRHVFLETNTQARHDFATFSWDKTTLLIIKHLQGYLADLG